MPDKGSSYRLQIERAGDGGYTVSSGWAINPDERAIVFFATSSIDEALDYIKGQIVPVGGPSPSEK